MARLSAWLMGAALAAGASVAAAEGNLALIVANQDYTTFRDARGAREALDAAEALEAAGYEVLEWQDLAMADLAEMASEAETVLAGADRIVVLIAGHFASSRGESWLLATDALPSGPLTAASGGLSVQALMSLAAGKAGAAVIMLGQDGPAQDLATGLQYGAVVGTVPQGVTVLSGPTDDLTDVLSELLVPGATTGAVAAEAPDSVSASGFLSDVVAFAPVAAEPGALSEADRELLLWTEAARANTEKALEDYLSRYPDGPHAADARDMLAELRKTPLDRAREAEAALALGPEARREVQRDLSLLGFDPHGIDGIFGRATRAAIGGWQTANGFDRTGFLTAEQLKALDTAATARAAALEEEARRRRAEQESQDTEYWRSTGRDGGEDGLRAYLGRYPDGLYSDIARERLAVFDEERRRTAALAEANAWDAAQAAGTREAYQDFLARYPDGAFADSARQKLAELQAQESDDDVLAAAKAEEKLVLANPITGVLVERQLDKLGLKPGKVDGRMDKQTRKALRRFQRASDLPVTGYATQQTVVRLLSTQGG